MVQSIEKVLMPTRARDSTIKLLVESLARVGCPTPVNADDGLIGCQLFAITAHAILPPDPPIGWVLWSSGFAWIISDDPSASSKLAEPSDKLTNEL